MILRREVTTKASPAAVFAYLSDFSTTTEWDPGTVKTSRASGDGGVGTVYKNRSSFAGRESDLTYTVIDRRDPEMIRLRGENQAVTAVDTIMVTPVGSGSHVVYQAEFTFKGLRKLAVPFLAPAFKKLGDEAEAGLREALARL